MINLAGKEDCDETIIKEIQEAGLNFSNLGFQKNIEVKSKYYIYYQGWEFTRAWYYWVATTCITPLLFKYADPLHKKYGKEIRVDGHCCCPAPREWHKKRWDIGVTNYHVDTQNGLNELVKTIEKQTKNNQHDN